MKYLNSSLGSTKAYVLKAQQCSGLKDANLSVPIVEHINTNINTQTERERILEQFANRTTNQIISYYLNLIGTNIFWSLLFSRPHSETAKLKTKHDAIFTVVLLLNAIS